MATAPLQDPSLTDLRKRILVAVPEAETFFAELDELHHGSISAGTLLAGLADLVGSSGLFVRAPGRDDPLVRSLDLVEGLLAERGEESCAEIAAAFFGNLPITAITSSLLWMGPLSLSALEALDVEEPLAG